MIDYIIILILLIMLINFLIYRKKQCKSLDKFSGLPQENYKLYIHTVFLLKENIPFLREWIIYNLKLGFTKIYLYDNTGSVGRNGSNKTTNKYNFNFDEIINLTDKQIDNELQDILTTYKDNLVYIKWQPKDKNGDIIYGFSDSVIDYTNRVQSDGIDNNDIIYTAFIDIDEFIYSSTNLNLIDLVINKYRNNINKIIIKQKKFTDRFCNNTNVIDIVDTIDNIDTTDWACKQIIKNDSIDIKNIVNMHNIGILNGKIETLEIDVLRFNHYNVNTKQIDWMKKFYKMNEFNFTTDNSLQKKYKDHINNICGNKCSDMINYSKIGKELCVSIVLP